LAPIADAYAWDFCQIQVNYADWTQRGAHILYETLAGRGIPIIVMEPVRGGGLTKLPEQSLALLKNMDPSRSPASWALRFAASLPDVDIILSGMSNLEQCEDNIHTFSDFTPLTDENKAVLEKVVDEFNSRPLIPCTQCRYCIECPQGIDIPTLFSYYNGYIQFQENWPLMTFYYRNTPPEHQAPACINCGYCTGRCPQKIAIPAEIARVHEAARQLAAQ
jgi:predicted aldo/keto reductase-like oxidoreductase